MWYKGQFECHPGKKNMNATADMAVSISLFTGYAYRSGWIAGRPGKEPMPNLPISLIMRPPGIGFSDFIGERIKRIVPGAKPPWGTLTQSAQLSFRSKGFTSSTNGFYILLNRALKVLKAIMLYGRIHYPTTIMVSL